MSVNGLLVLLQAGELYACSWLWGSPLWNPFMALGPDSERRVWTGPLGCRGTSFLVRRTGGPSLNLFLASLWLDSGTSCLLPVVGYSLHTA